MPEVNIGCEVDIARAKVSTCKRTGCGHKWTTHGYDIFGHEETPEKFDPHNCRVEGCQCSHYKGY